MRIKRILQNIILPSSVLCASVLAISCAKTNQNYTDEIKKLNEGKIDNVSLDNLHKLANNSKILYWKNPQTDISKISIKNLFLNNFLKNNLMINKQELKNALESLGLKHSDKISAEIVINEVNRDFSNVEYLSVPLLIKRHIKTVSGEINEFQTRKVVFKIKGLSVDKNIETRKETLYSFLKDKYDVENGLNIVKKDKVSISLNNDFKLDHKLSNLSNKKLNEAIKLRFNDLSDDQYYNNLTLVQKQEQADPKNSEKDLFNIEIKSFEIDPDNYQNYLIKFKLAYGKSSKKISNNPYNLDKNINNIAVDLIYKGTFSSDQIDLEHILKNNAKIELKYDLSFINYPWDKANKDDFIARSKSNQFSYKIDSIKKLDQYGRLGFNLIVDDSKVESLKGKIVYVESGVSPHAYIFNPELQDSQNKFNMILEDIDSNILTKITQNIYDKANRSQILPGGYGELRGFYNSPNLPKQIHLGEDVLVKEGTDIIAPFDADIISFGTAKNEKQFSGVGGRLVLRVKKDQLKNIVSKNNFEDIFEDAEYVYVGIIHLDYAATLPLLQKISSDREIKETEKYITWDVTYNNPIPVKKGTVIAKVGKFENNGGWMPHAHITTWKQENFIKDDNGYLYKTYDYLKRYSRDSAKPGNFVVRVEGVRNGTLPVQDIKTKKSKDEYKTDVNANPIGDEFKENSVRVPYLNIRVDEMDKSLFDPNLIFNFRDNNTLTFEVHDLFKELKNS
ncbi:MSC_0775 family lipoprotein [Mycoplasma tauri]|uniref:MSC_0775 family lipoprotein n=1 Tax=Mycoplasma tauri TaxID=547987 RepID=UPI001CBA8A34|nr:hypothetical protein [Mycoplasma tauri]MBZ4204340.1 hypothetical protein [Mycoplasma tauri]